MYKAVELAATRPLTSAMEALKVASRTMLYMMYNTIIM